MKIVGVVIVIVALVIIGLLAYLNLTAVEVAITNAGPAPLPVRGQLPSGAEPLLAALGVRGLPDELRPGVTASVRVPPVGGEIDASTPGVISVTMLGQAVRFAGTCERLTLNGDTLLGRRTAFQLGERARHEVQLACR